MERTFEDGARPGYARTAIPAHAKSASSVLYVMESNWPVVFDDFFFLYYNILECICPGMKGNLTPNGGSFLVKIGTLPLTFYVLSRGLTCHSSFIFSIIFLCSSGISFTLGDCLQRPFHFPTFT